MLHPNPRQDLIQPICLVLYLLHLVVYNAYSLCAYSGRVSGKFSNLSLHSCLVATNFVYDLFLYSDSGIDSNASISVPSVHPTSIARLSAVILVLRCFDTLVSIPNVLVHPYLLGGGRFVDNLRDFA